jgi:hypothetical protein
LGVGGAKLAGLLAAGAVATAGGGLVVAQEAHHGVGRHPPSARTVRSTPAQSTAVVVPTRRVLTTPAHAAPVKVAARRQGRTQHIVVPRSAKRRIEFAPRGSDLTATPTVGTTPKAVRATAPRPVPPGSDSTRGEFAPQP